MIKKTVKLLFSFVIYLSLIHLDQTYAQPRVVLDNEKLVYRTDKSGDYSVEIRHAEKRDVVGIVRLNRQAFVHDNNSDEDAQEWIEDHMNSGNKSHYYVIVYKDSKGQESSVIGYTLWEIKGGYKSNLAVQMEQMAVDENYQRQNFGTALLWYSRHAFEKDVRTLKKSNDYRLASIAITTGVENKAAAEFYAKVLDVKNYGNIGPIYGGNQYGDSEISLININPGNHLESDGIKKILSPGRITD